MEELDYSKQGQRKTERIVLYVYLLYIVGTASVMRSNKWDNWLVIVLFFMIGWFVSLTCYIGRYRNYRFRAFLTSGLFQASIVVFSLQAPNLFSHIATFMAIIVVFGLYGIPNLIYLSVFATTLLFGYHVLFVGVAEGMETGRIVTVAQQVFFVYLSEYIVFFLVRRQSESNISQQKIIEELRGAERSKDDFLANVSHELRTPINTICGMSEIVQYEDVTEKVREEVLSIQTAGRNLLSVVSDVLDFSELQSGKMEIEEVSYNITSTVHDVINMTMARNDKNLELLVDCDVNIPCELLGDEQKIRRAIMNLVDNAIKFTNDGCICIAISHRKTPYGINLCIKVEDTGIGMKEESLEKMFKSYNQADTGRSRQEGGIGLGFAISRALVDKMGGFIKVDSQFEKGTEVQFVIPQKVLKEDPIVEIRNSERLNLAIYFNIERQMAEIRDVYLRNINHMLNQTGVKSHVCRNLAEIKRRVERERYTHIFIGITEYEEAMAYFDSLSQLTKIVVVLKREEEHRVHNPQIVCLHKPFYSLPIAMLLNEDRVETSAHSTHHYGRFIAPKAHLLVVDDSLMNIKVLEGLLRPYQIRVSMAMSGAEALEKIETKEYDFVFMDHMMPEMDGIETMHRIRQKQGNYYRNVPIIVLTANAVAGMREMFLEEGFDDYVSKPVELSVLERVLKRYIPENKILKGDFPSREEERRQPAAGNALEIGDLDVSQGLAFCGGEENYIEILQIHVRDGGEQKAKIQQFYEQRDWDNYTIVVHALKSSMKSIGAMHLSQMAKDLEQAGKEKNAPYIIENHDAMMAEYTRVLGLLSSNPRVNPQQDSAEEDEELEELSDEAFDRYVIELEDAMYTFESGNMLEVLEKLQQYRYHGQSLKQPLEPVKKKVEMSDLMPALEVVLKLKEKLKNEL